MKSILLIGATGLIGRHCLDYLLGEKWVGLVTVLSRKELPVKNRKLVNEIVDFEHIEKYKRRIKADVFISTFGTTFKKAGKSKEVFYKWEVDYPLNTARIAFENGCRHFIFVSAAGVSEYSPVYYSRAKGIMEKLAVQIGFQTVDIFQPSFLLGERDEHRPVEVWTAKIVPYIKPLFAGPFQAYAPIEAADVARAIVRKAENSSSGINRYTYREIQSIISEKSNS